MLIMKKDMIHRQVEPLHLQAMEVPERIKRCKLAQQIMTLAKFLVVRSTHLHFQLQVSCIRGVSTSKGSVACKILKTGADLLWLRICHRIFMKVANTMKSWIELQSNKDCKNKVRSRVMAMQGPGVRCITFSKRLTSQWISHSMVQIAMVRQVCRSMRMRSWGRWTSSLRIFSMKISKTICICCAPKSLLSRLNAAPCIPWFAQTWIDFSPVVMDPHMHLVMEIKRLVKGSSRYFSLTAIRQRAHRSLESVLPQSLAVLCIRVACSVMALYISGELVAIMLNWKN